jgi:hypothetical protein
MMGHPDADFMAATFANQRRRALTEAARVPTRMAFRHRLAMEEIEAADPELEGKGNGEEHDLHRFIAEALEQAASDILALSTAEGRPE